MDQDYYKKPENVGESKTKQNIEEFKYLNINDTIIKPMTFQMLEKFNGSSDENVYLLIYRKKPTGLAEGSPPAPTQATPETDFAELEVFNGNLPNLKARVKRSNPILTEILSDNEKVKMQRNMHDDLKSKIRVYFLKGRFSGNAEQELNSAKRTFVIEAEEHFRLRQRVTCDDMDEIVSEISEIASLEQVLPAKLDLDLAEHLVFEVDVKYDKIVHYRHIVDFQLAQLQLQNETEEELRHINHNSVLLFLKKENFPLKFKSFVDNFDGSEPVQLIFKYKNAETKLYCQRGWDLERVNQFFYEEIRGRVLETEKGEKVSVPDENFHVRSLYISVNYNMVNLQTMAKTRPIDDLIYHNQEICYVERKPGTTGGDQPDRDFIEVIFEKKYDVRTMDFELDATLEDVFEVSRRVT